MEFSFSFVRVLFVVFMHQSQMIKIAGGAGAHTFPMVVSKVSLICIATDFVHEKHFSATSI